MRRTAILLTLIINTVGVFQAKAAIEFVYGIKERVYQQFGNTQASTPIEWHFGAGASGDDQLTAVSVTPLGSNTPVILVNEGGDFDLETDNYQSQAELDAVYPNGTLSYTITDNGSTQNLGPFTITGNSYPPAPHILNTEELDEHEFTQAFELSWDAFSGADAGDQILIQVWDNNTDEELIFEFLDPATTSFNILADTFNANNEYDIDIIFINETDNLVSPDTIIGYLSTTSYKYSTHTSDTNLVFYKWQGNLQTGSDTVTENLYRPLTSVTGESNTVTDPVIITQNSILALNNVGPNTFFLVPPFDTKETLDNVYPAGEISFSLTENGSPVSYGPYQFPSDAYPTPPQFQNFFELQNFDATENQIINWNSVPVGVSRINLVILDNSNQSVWSEDPDTSATSFQLPGDTLSQDSTYRLILRFWAPAFTQTKPPTSMGYIAATSMEFQTSSGGGGDPGVEFVYTIKEQAFFQDGDTAPTNPFKWSFGAGVSGGFDVTGGVVFTPNGGASFSGSGGEYELDNEGFSSQADLDAQYPNGEYWIEFTVDGSDQLIGPFAITDDDYPIVPQVLNATDFLTQDLDQPINLQWNVFTDSTTQDRIVLEISDFSNDEDIVFEFLEASATSYQIPGGTLTQGNQYEVNIRFVNEVDDLESPDTIVGYVSHTVFTLATGINDTELLYYKWQRNLQTDSNTVNIDGYRPFIRVIGNSSTISSAALIDSVDGHSLNPIGNNTFLLLPIWNSKEVLDTSYPAGEFIFSLTENGFPVNYVPYFLPPDNYPLPPKFLNFEQLQMLDVTLEQPINWPAVSDGVTQITLRILDESNIPVWSADLEPQTTSALIPPDTLTAFQDYRIFIGFWSRQTGGNNPEASIGYTSSTYMPIKTFASGLDYAGWQAIRFEEAELLDADISGENADPDGDKLTNYFEFLALLNPKDPQSSITYFIIDQTLHISPLTNSIPWELRSSSNLSDWSVIEMEQYQLVGNEVQIDLQTLPSPAFIQAVVSDDQ